MQTPNLPDDEPSTGVEIPADLRDEIPLNREYVPDDIGDYAQVGHVGDVIVYPADLPTEDIHIVKEGISLAHDIIGDFHTFPESLNVEVFLLPDQPGGNKFASYSRTSDGHIQPYVVITPPFHLEVREVKQKTLHAIIHEYVEIWSHIIEMKSRGTIGTHPDWWHDGLAELLVATGTPDNVPMNRYTERIEQRLQVLERVGIPPNKLDFIAVGPYDIATLFVAYLVDTFGPAAIVDILESNHSDFVQRIKHTTGMGSEQEIIHEWESWLQNGQVRKYYLSEIEG